MGALTGSSDVIAGAKPPKAFLKSSITTVAGGFSSLWYTSGLPGAGVTAPLISGGGGTCDDTTAGALSLPELAAGEDMYLAQLQATSNVASTLVLYDRLVHASGINSNSTAAQTINSVALPSRAPTNGVGVEVWLEWRTAGGATNQGWSMNYTDDAGNTGNTSVATGNLGTSIAANRMFMLPLAAGDQGVRAVASVTATAASGTNNDIVLVLLKRLAQVTIPATALGQALDYLALITAKINGASGGNKPCLALMVLASTTSSGTMLGQVGVTVK
jgi:hypothetical protein